MGPRLRRLISAAAVVYAGARLSRLLETTVEGPPWQIVVGTTLVIGALVTWTMRAIRVSPLVAAAVHAIALTLMVFMVATPDHLVLGFLPGDGAIDALRRELSIAGELIRFGAAPVLPVPGLTAILGGLFWGFGVLLASGRPELAGILSVVLYLQFATLDRRPPSLVWTAGFLVLATTVIAAFAPPRKERVGRARAESGELIPRRSTGAIVTAGVAAILVAIGATTSFAGTVPEAGVLQWRTQSGVGSGLYGSGSFNLFVGLQQSLVDLSDDPMFYARLSSSAPPNDQIYWKLITLDAFNGENWIPSEQSFARGGRPRWERTDWRFQGDTVRVAANIRIAGLSGQFLPTLYSPIALESDEPLISESFRVREDGSIAVDLQAMESWTYQLDADLPQPDVNRLATAPTGDLSPIFENAVAAGVADVTAVPVDEDTEVPTSIEDDYTQLPDVVDEDLEELALQVTTGASTDFERAVLLESFFRDPELFTYSTEVDTGHAALDLTAWLVDPESQNFRTGYCEQFATAMAVMGRVLEIPSRVVLGFTPGDTERQADGSDIVVVRENNAHAWVEMWMDGQGWVRFDPTPRSDGVNPSLAGETVGFDVREYIPAPDETAGSAAGSTDFRNDLIDPGALIPEGELTGTPQDVSGFAWVGPWVWGFVALAALAAAVPLVKVIRRRRRLAAVREGDVAAAWQEIVDRLTDLGSDVDPSDTPIEIAEHENPDLLPLAQLYTAAAYGGKTNATCLMEFARAEGSLKRGYPPKRWVVSNLSPESLLGDRPVSLVRRLSARR